MANYNGATADEMMLALWGILTFCFFVQTLRINRGLQTLFISLTILFFLLAGGVKNALCNKVRHLLTRSRLAPASLLSTSLLAGVLYTSWRLALASWLCWSPGKLLAACLCKPGLLVRWRGSSEDTSCEALGLRFGGIQVQMLSRAYWVC